MLNKVTTITKKGEFRNEKYRHILHFLTKEPIKPAPRLVLVVLILKPRRATLPTVSMAGFLTPRPLGAGHHHHHHRCHRRHYQNNNDNKPRRHIDNNGNNTQRRDGLGACVREKGVEGHRAGDLYDRGQ